MAILQACALLLAGALAGCAPPAPLPAPSRVPHPAPQYVNLDVHIRAGAVPPVLEFVEDKSGARYAVDTSLLRQKGKRALAAFLEAAGSLGATDLRLDGTPDRAPAVSGGATPLRLRGAEVLTIESLPVLCPAAESRGHCLLASRQFHVVRSQYLFATLWRDFAPLSGDAFRTDFSRQMVVVLVEPALANLNAADALARTEGGSTVVEWSAEASATPGNGAFWHALVLPARPAPVTAVLNLKHADGRVERIVLEPPLQEQ